MQKLKSEQMPNLASIQEYQQFDAVLLECINTLRSGEGLDTSINHLLEIVADFHEADRAYIFEFDEELMDNTYEWCREGVGPEMQMLQRLKIQDHIARWLVLFQEQGEVYINSLGDDVDKDSEEYRMLEMQGVDSLMVAPIYLAQKLIGFIGVDNPRKNTEILLLLRSVAAFVANDIQKRETIDQKVIKAIGRTYVSMYLFNLPMNTHQEYKTNQNIRNCLIGPDKVREQMKQVITSVSAEEYHEEMITFTRISTLNRRMKKTDYISHEFLGISKRWFCASFIVVSRLEDGSIENVLFAVQEIDEEKRREMEYQRALKTALENKNEMYAEMLKMQGGGVIAYDVETKAICVMNDAAREMFGFEGTEGHDGDFSSLQDRVLSENKDIFIQEFKDKLRKYGQYNCEYTLNNGSRIVHIMAHTKIVTLGNGQKIALSSLTDATETKKLEQQLRRLSQTDALTQISNRGYGERRVEMLLKEGTPGMLCLFDIDKFKSINDTYGHAAGDRVLIAVAKCVKDSFGSEDVIMRLGGDEFAVYAVGVTSEKVGGESIYRFFMKLDELTIDGMEDFKVAVSLGATLCDGIHRNRFDELYQMADSAMYICKKKKGNHFEFYKEK